MELGYSSGSSGNTIYLNDSSTSSMLKMKERTHGTAVQQAIHGMIITEQMLMETV